MRWLRRSGVRLSALLFALSAVWWALPARADEGPWVTYPDDPIDLKQRRLANGLTVLLSENHEVPRIFGAVIVRAGGKNDPASATGIAHYLEHMLFKGTEELGTVDAARERPHLQRITALYERLRTTTDEEERAGLLAAIDRESQAAGKLAIPNELDRLLQEMGGTGVNAFTTPDITVYYNAFPARSVDRWLWLYAHRFQDPVFRLFPSELEAVYEEKNQSMDSFEPIAEVFLKHFFPTHPYGSQVVLGSVEHLKNPSLKEMYAFYRRYYVPGNMALALSGDFDAEAIWPVIEEQFGSWPEGPVPAQPPARERPLSGRTQVTVRMTPVRITGLGFRLPPPGHPDYAATLVANELLSNDQEVGYLDQLARDGAVLLAQAVPIPLNDYGVGLVAVVPRLLTQSFAGAEKKLLGELAKLKRGAFTDAELAAARRSLVNEQRAQWEDNEERVLAMVESFGRGERWQDYLDFLAQLDAVDRDQLIRAARTYYGDDFLVLRSRVGFPPKTRLEKPEMRPVEPATGRSPFAGQLAAVPDRPTTPRFIDFNADVETALVTRGVHVQANKNPFNDIYTLELRHGIGMYDLPALEVVDDYLTDVGSATRGADEFKRALFLLATTLEFEATEEEFIVRLSGPEAQLPEALALVDEILNAPAEDGAALRRLCRERWGLNLVAKREPEVIADALREYVTFGRGSTYLRAVSTRELMGTRPRKLVKALQQARRHAVTIRYVGARRAAELAELARAKLHFPARLKPARPPVVRPRKVPKTDQVYWVKRRQSVQTQIILSVDGEPMTAALRPWADAYNEYFGGSMGGLLFQEVRELRALAYAVGGAYLEHAVAGQPGLLLIAAATQADKTLEAITVMRALVQDLPRKADRIPGLRSALVRSQEAAQPGFRALQEYIHAWRLRGFNDDPRRGLLPAYARLELDDIARFHAAHIRDRPQTVMVVGDPRRVSKKELARFGEVHVVPTRKLFSR